MFLYKRAQILVGDLWGAFKGQGLGSFTDIQSITMFADYLVPAVLREWGVLGYSKELSRKVDGRIELVPGIGFIHFRIQFRNRSRMRFRETYLRYKYILYADSTFKG